ncbi:hypothetical protein PPYR_08833 [Photinus pyralis]|uniref:Multidrug resistance-associated protein lethal(2)03659 n=5 Tax=Photinus pyralis TaxID=7054 RepID=A0A5N4AKH1_PHOPY|nr:hypothetical protein PPYR_08833 [Photinus pyralis]
MDFEICKNLKPNPRENANILSVATIWHAIPTFLLGRTKDLEVSDLYHAYSSHQSKVLGDRIETAWAKEEEAAQKLNRKPSLKRVLIKLFACDYLVRGIISLIVEFPLKLFQPLLLGKLIAYFGGQESISKSAAYGFAAGVVGCAFLRILLTSPLMVSLLHMGLKIRVACCSLVYRKTLRLSKAALGTTTVGQMVNLLSNDVNRFDVGIRFAHFLIIGPIQVIAATYFMYQQVGVSALFGVGVLLSYVPLQFTLAKLIAKFRFKMAYKTDERIRLMNEVISGIQVIKMYLHMGKAVHQISLVGSKLIHFRNEIGLIRSISLLRGVINSFFVFGTPFALFITFLSYVLFGKHITAEKVFVLNAFYNVIRLTMCSFFVRAVEQVSEVNVSLRRLNDFLLNDEKSQTICNEAEINTSKDQIIISHAIAKWSELMSSNIFVDLNVRVKRGSTVAIIGPVGSGKSSLLNLILKELPLTEGRLKVVGTVSLAAQEAWIFSGSVRQNILFDQPFNKVRYKEVVSVCSLSRDFELLSNGDSTIVGDRGVSLSGGQRARINLARAVYRHADIYLLDDPLSAVDTHVGRELFERCICGYMRDNTVILVTHQVQFLKEVDNIIIIEDGTVKAQGTYAQLQESGLDFAKLLHNQESTTKAEEETSFVSESHESYLSVENNQTLENSEETTKGTVSLDTYICYITAGAHWFFLLCIAALFIATQLISSFGDVLLSRWVTVEPYRFANITNAKYQPRFWDNLSTDTYIYIYTGTISTLITLSLARSLLFFTVCMRSSVKLHDSMFNNVIHATLRFFNTTPSGRILNRFSKDMGAMDELLPDAFLDYVQLSLSCCAIVSVIASVNPWLLVPTAPIAAVLYCLRRFYLATSRSIKRLEGVTRSPVFGHLNASLQGLTTIRAFEAEPTLTAEFDKLQDLHSSAWYLLISTTYAFAYWLDIICVIYIGIVTFSFFAFDDSPSGGNVGLAITQSITLVGLFQFTIRQSAETENQMTSVERILNYNKIEQESTLDTHPPKDWPNKCAITFSDAFLYYFLHDPPVLTNLSFCIKPMEKVGVVGRTGAGKSSLINALFQLTDTSGLISIGAVNIKEISLKDLRSRMSIIPQEPVLFSGTMRTNLDPFDEYPDDALWKALAAVQLTETVREQSLGLNSAVQEGGSNYSVGQRQLICLARAILRNNEILILDEATANVDPLTDAVIQTTIRRQFSQCTVLTIAHRLHTIMDSDKVLVMDAGTVVEFDHPYALLQNKNGIFRGTVLQTGTTMSDRLTKIAEKSYEERLS